MPDVFSGEDRNERHKSVLASVSAVDLSVRFPSTYPKAVRERLFPASAIQKELCVRRAQAHDAIANLRRNVRVSAKVFDDKRKYASGTGQKRTTRMDTLHARYKCKASLDAERYNSARNALTALDPGGSWQDCLKELKPEHIRIPGRRSTDESEGRRDISWIWKATRDLKASSSSSSRIEDDGLTDVDHDAFDREMDALFQEGSTLR